MKQTPATLKDQAAVMIAEGRYSFEEIAEKIGITPRGLFKWRQQPEFKSRVEQLQEEFKEAALRRGIARQDYRLTCLADLQNRLRRVVEERAADPSMQDIPGGSTGLVVRQYKMSGDNCMPEYTVDTATIRELRALQEQAAKELGQIVDKSESTSSVTLKDERRMSDEEIKREIAAIVSRQTPKDSTGDTPQTSEGTGEAEESER